MHSATIMDGFLRPTHIKINLEQIVHNYHQIRRFCQRPVMAILKANAYGHGIIEVAKRLEKESVAYFGLAYLEEAVLLRKSGIETPILVLGGVIGEQIPTFIEYDLTITASSVDKLKAIEAAARALGTRAKVHLKIDTGMERIGVHYYSAEAIIQQALKCEHVLLEGIFSHFANADCLNNTYSQLQLERFQMVLRSVEEVGLQIPIRHMSNSGAVLQFPQARFDMVRVGLLLYGVYPSMELPRKIDVSLAMKWVTRVVYFKVVKPNHPVSYGSLWKSNKMVRVVTIPVGYGDGYHRRMTGSAKVLIRGKRYPLVGAICMDQAMVNIDWDEAYNGDEVVLLGKQGESEITVEELAQWAGTIPYEILTSINTRVSRVHEG